MEKLRQHKYVIKKKHLCQASQLSNSDCVLFIDRMTIMMKYVPYVKRAENFFSVIHVI